MKKKPRLESAEVSYYGAVCDLGRNDWEKYSIIAMSAAKAMSVAPVVRNQVNSAPSTHAKTAPNMPSATAAIVCPAEGLSKSSPMR